VDPHQPRHAHALAVGGVDHEVALLDRAAVNLGGQPGRAARAAQVGRALRAPAPRRARSLACRWARGQASRGGVASRVPGPCGRDPFVPDPCPPYRCLATDEGTPSLIHPHLPART
jgi:hypothetical protein